MSGKDQLISKFSKNKYHLPHLQNFALHFVVLICLPLFVSTVGGCDGCTCFSGDLPLVMIFLFSHC